MNEQIKEELTLAREAMGKEEYTEALKHYAAVYSNDTKDEEVLEAEYFTLLFHLEDTSYKIKSFSRICEITPNVIKEIADSSSSDAIKHKQIVAICGEFIPCTWSLYKWSHNNQILKRGIAALYELGNAIEKEFGNKGAAIHPWKEAVSLQQKFYNVLEDKTLPEKYTKKIQSVEPDYVMPEKSGCISLGDKR